MVQEMTVRLPLADRPLTSHLPNIRRTEVILVVARLSNHPLVKRTGLRRGDW